MPDGYLPYGCCGGRPIAQGIARSRGEQVAGRLMAPRSRMRDLGAVDCDSIDATQQPP